MSSIEKGLDTNDIAYFSEVSNYQTLGQKTAKFKKNNKFRYSTPLDSKMKTIIGYFVKIFGGVIIVVCMFAVIYYSSIEFINMKYGSNYEDMYDKPDSGAAKFRAIPNIREQVKIKAEREMIFNKISEAVEHLE